jgi:hypothetical protein
MLKKYIDIKIISAHNQLTAPVIARYMNTPTPVASTIGDKNSKIRR